MKKRNGLFLLIILFIGIGFAYLTANLLIGGSGILARNSWNMYFDNISFLEGEEYFSEKPMTIGNTTKDLSFTLDLDKPGDRAEFIVEIVNDSTVDAMFDLYTSVNNLNDGDEKYVSYKVEYADGMEFSVSDMIEKGSFDTLRVTVEYNDDIEIEDLANVPSSFEFTVGFDYTQATSEAKVRDYGIAVIKHGDKNYYGWEVGSIIRIKDQDFYVLDSMYFIGLNNLNVGGSVSGNTLTPYTTFTGLQDRTMRGYVEGESTYNGAIVFSNTNYWDNGGVPKNEYGSSYPADVLYGNDEIMTILNDYKEYLRSVSSMVRMWGGDDYITIPDLYALEELGCDSITKSCENAPDFVTNSSYWTQAANDFGYLWGVTSDGRFDTYAFDQLQKPLGIRPAIQLEW